MSLEQILDDLFFKNEEPLRLLTKHGLDRILENSIQVVKLEIEKPTINFVKFGYIASNILVGINTRLRGVNDPIEKGYLELILKDITEYLLDKVIQKSNDPEKLIREISFALQTASSINGYNYEALIRLLKLENGKKKDSSEVNGIFHFHWNGYPQDLSELISTLKHEAWIPTVRDFKRLFEKHDGLLKIQFSGDKISNLLALFDELKDKRLITPKGCKGHFHPLFAYLVDLENNLLFKNHPKTIKMIAKRNLDNWQRMRENAKTMIDPYKVKVTLRLPSPR